MRRQIGEGGMGSVWSAVHETIDRTVAIKFLRPSVEDAETAAARFVTEAKSAGRVKHRFVVDVFDFGITEDGIYYMVQELLEGEELADSMDHGAAWQVRDVAQFIARCLNGLEAVHQAGIVHRDLKPENIFVMRDSDGRYPKLLDFGISKLSDAFGVPSMVPAARVGRTKQLTTTGTTLGTPWYMSPEQLRGRRDLDGRADVYSIGVILYEWLTGRVPYEQDNIAELSLQVASGSAVPLVSLRPELGHGLSSVVARALAPEPEGRFSSAAEMRDALTAVIPSLPTAWSVVQKSAKSAQAPIGAKTELLLKAAANAFGEESTDLGLGGASWRHIRPYIRPWMFAAAAVFVLGLISLSLFRDARPERAVAKEIAGASPKPGTASSQQAKPEATQPASSEMAPQLREGASNAEVRPLADTQRMPEGPATATAPERTSTPRSAPSERASVTRTQKSRSNKKVIRTLDF